MKPIEYEADMQASKACYTPLKSAEIQARGICPCSCGAGDNPSARAGSGMRLDQYNDGREDPPRSAVLTVAMVW